MFHLVKNHLKMILLLLNLKKMTVAKMILKWRQLQIHPQMQFHRQKIHLQIHQQVNHLPLRLLCPSHRTITSRFASDRMETTWMCSKTAPIQGFCLRAPSTGLKSA